MRQFTTDKQDAKHQDSRYPRTAHRRAGMLEQLPARVVGFFGLNASHGTRQNHARLTDVLATGVAACLCRAMPGGAGPAAFARCLAPR